MLSSQCHHCGNPITTPDGPGTQEISASLLRSNYIPSQDEKAGLSLSIENAATEAAYINTEIQRLQDLVKNLKAQQVRTQHYILAAQSLFAPVRRLPMELLGKIFSETRIQSRIEISSQGEGDKIWHLGQVCSFWRSALLSHRQLWSHISITRATLPDQDIILQRLSSCLERSDPLSLTLEMEFAYYHQDFFYDAIAMLTPHSHRWRSIVLQLDRDLTVAPDFMLLENLVNLNTFVMNGGTLDHENVKAFSFAPRLTEVGLFNNQGSIATLNVPWHQLTSLALGPPLHFNRLFDILKLTSNLEHLAWSEFEWDSSDLSIISARDIASTLQLSHLKAIRYDILYPRPDNPLFSYLVAPQLTELHITLFDTQYLHPARSDACADAVVRFVKRSDCKITTLILDRLSLQSATRIFTEVPTVRNLTWKGTLDSTNFVTSLLCWDGILPALESVTFDKYCPATSLTELIESRKVKSLLSGYHDSRACCHLRELRITLNPPDACYYSSQFLNFAAQAGVVFTIG